jgi:hypothetical protein
MTRYLSRPYEMRLTNVRYCKAALKIRQAIGIGVLAAAVGLPGCTEFLCIACDGYLGATGNVYEWLDAPIGAKSLAFVDTAPLNAHRVSPLVGAEITLEPWTPGSQPPAGDATRARRHTVTDQDGHFRVGGTVRPGNFKAALSVRASGFQPVQHRFDHDRQTNHVVRVLLVREK